MGPTVPAPLTRAAARRSAPGLGLRPRLLHTLALSGGAFAGALIVLGLGSLAGVSSMDSPVREVRGIEQIAVPAPRATPGPTPRSSPSAEETASDQLPEPVPSVEIVPAAPTEPDALVPAPEPPASEPVIAEPAPESGPGKSATAPGKNKPAKP